MSSQRIGFSHQLGHVGNASTNGSAVSAIGASNEKASRCTIMLKAISDSKRRKDSLSSGIHGLTGKIID